jgi:CRISPR-associated protein Cas1
MARPRCDPFEVAFICAAIDRGETTERAAYLTYAATAARPYARSTFALMLRNAANGAGIERAQDEPDSDAFWAVRLKVKPSIVTTCADNASLRVKGGALIVFDGAHSLTYAAGGKHPSAIVMAGWGGHVSIEAVRFCASHRIAVIALDWMHDFLMIMSPAPKASTAILRAQAMADPAWIARRVVQMKIESAGRVGALPLAQARKLIEAASSGSVQDVMTIEAQAARLSWGEGISIRWRDGPVPSQWKQPWLARARIDTRAKRHATHPVNAALNAVFSVTAGRIAAYLFAQGAQPAIGYLHADKPGRFSLAYDAIEPLRPAIEASVFRFIGSNRFGANDFIRIRDAHGSLRLAESFLRVLLSECALPSCFISDAAARMIEIILAAPRQGEFDKCTQRVRNVKRVGASVGGGSFERGETPILLVGSSRERR